MSAFDSADNENERRVINEFLEELRDTAAVLILERKGIPKASKV